MIKNYLIKFYTPEGNSLIKNIPAESLSEAKSAIILEGYMPVLALPNIFLDILRPVRNAGMKDKELSVFFMEFYQLAKSSGSVSKALSYMDKEHKKPFASGKYKLLYPVEWLYYNHKLSKSRNRLKLINNCVSLLNKGETLKEIFISNNFEEIVLSLLDLADSTGDYPQTFLKISEYFDTKNIYKKSITGALAYPAFLFFLLFVAFLVFLYYIIPTFALFFSQFPHIPQSTENILSLFNYLKNIFVYCIILAAFALAAFGFDLFKVKTKTASFMYDIPQIRSIVNYGYLNWIFYQFSLMISSGVTVNGAFNYFRKNTSKIYFKNKFELIYADLIRGITLHDSMVNANFLSEDVVESIGYAEIGGFLPETVLGLSQEFKEKSRRYIELFTKGLFFLAIVSVVAFLLLMFFSLFLPLIQGMVELPANY
ncbi:MAG: type II secretion system F family protein [Deltaproteobacteria bacterium]|nr:type II secretion system F family protein [Deltaproteobacteria bacterium]